MSLFRPRAAENRGHLPRTQNADIHRVVLLLKRSERATPDVIVLSGELVRDTHETKRTWIPGRVAQQAQASLSDVRRSAGEGDRRRSGEPFAQRPDLRASAVDGDFVEAT